MFFDPEDWDAEELTLLRKITKDLLTIAAFLFVFSVFLVSCASCFLVFATVVQ